MKEVNTRQPEENPQQSSINAAEAAQEKQQAQQEQRIHPPVMPPPLQEKSEENSTVKPQQDTAEELNQSGAEHKPGKKQKKSKWSSRDDDLVNEILGGLTEEQVKAHNEEFARAKEEERLKKEKQYEEATKYHEELQAHLAARTPEERAASSLKTRFKLKNRTDEELRQLLRKMHENVIRTERKKAAWLHERDPRYDPMTGDLLEPDEHPLDARSEYTFYGKTRARSFVHPEARRFLSPDSPLLNHRQPLQADEMEEVLESEPHKRLVARLLKAGFIEVEPTLVDKASFEQRQWYRRLSPHEKMQLLQDSMPEMSRVRSRDKESVSEIFAELLEFLIYFMIALISPERMEKKYRDQAA